MKQNEEKYKVATVIEMPVREENDRLILYGYAFTDKSYDHPEHCAHGIKLRWSCDYCEEYFEGKTCCD